MIRLRAAFLGLIVSCAGLLHALPGLTVDSECTTGGFIRVVVTGSYRRAAEYAELRSGSGTVLSQNLLFHLPDGGDDILHTLLGVPDSLEAGIYKVTVSSASDLIVDSRVITVRSLEYRTETIHLSDSLSDLRRTDDQRRIWEAKRLWELINQRNPDALFHFGPFGVPVEDGVTTSYFGDRRLFVYVDVQSDRSVHSGIDLAGPAGTPVYSSGGGRVVLAAERLITGNTVVIEHLPGVYSLYYHLEEIRAAAGDQVSGGAVIGTIGSSGLATGPHLHWEIRIGGIYVDPSVMTGFSF
jgi:hypothetical protein